MRNPGFIIYDTGWILSPAFDLNPSDDKNGLALNIDMDNNALDFDLARSVGDFFQLTKMEMDLIINEVTSAVKDWKNLAQKIGISKSEIEYI